MPTIKILIIDDNKVFRDDLMGQLDKVKNVSAIAVMPNVETVKKLIDEDPSITDLLIDYLLSSECKAPDFIKKLKIDIKNKRIWFVTGKYTSNQTFVATKDKKKESILQIRKEYQYIKYIFLKPVTTDEILLRIRHETQEDEFEVENYPFLKHFPLPIRIIDLKTRSVVFHNDKWTWDVLHPDPEVQYQKPNQTDSEFSCYDFDNEKIIEKDYRLQSFELKAKEFRAEFCEPLIPRNRYLREVIEKNFKQMQEKGFVRGRFYMLVKTENFNSNHPQSYLELCKVLPSKRTNKKPWHPLYGFTKQRIEDVTKGEPKIRFSCDEDSKDEGNKFWNEIVDTNGLKSFLELPIFVNGEVRGLMMFDRMGSKKVDDTDPSEVPETVIHRENVFFKRIIEDAELFLKNDFDRKRTELTDKIDPLLQNLMDTEFEEKALLQQVLDKAIEFIKADGGYFVNSEGENSSRLEVRATNGNYQNLLQGASISSDKKHSLIAECFIKKKNIIIQNYHENSEFYLGNKEKHHNLERTFQSLFNETKPGVEIKLIIKWATEDINSIACFPLFYRNKVFGIFEIHSSKEYFFDEFKVNALTIYFQRIMGLLGVVRLHETMQNWQGRAIAHEILNDTGPILQTLDNIKSLDLSPELKKFHKRIENHTQNIRMLAENFFALNPEYGPSEDKTFSNQFECFKHYLDLKSEDIEEEQIVIDFPQIDNANDTLWQHQLQGDDISFRRVIRVLLDNAINHTSKELQKTVSISLNQEHRYFEIVIENPGKLDEEDKNNLFNPFYRKKNHGHKGMHIGLAASKKTVTRLGGDIDFCNTQDQHSVKATLKWPLMLKEGGND